MEAVSTVSSKGRITIPKPIRDECRIRAGDRIVFRSTEHGAVIIRAPDLADLTAIVPVPEGREMAAWDKIRQMTREAKAMCLDR